ncbi:helix-turn-helix domain-containing protein, partial [Weissella confusa]
CYSPLVVDTRNNKISSCQSQGDFFMSRKPRYSAEMKADLVSEFLASSKSLRTFAESKDIPHTTLEAWLAKWRVHGMVGLITKQKNAKYSEEFKSKVVIDHLVNGKTLSALMEEHKLPSSSLISAWIRQYNKAKITADKPSRKRDRTLARKTTKNERIKIAQQVIDGMYSYQEAADAYDVSYQMVYGWVRKLQAGGPDALEDHRGKTKNNFEQSREDKTLQENRKLRKRVRELEVAEALLKKLQEIQRREDY